jgi:hypothetical protein
MKPIISPFDGDLTLRLMLGMRYCERILSEELDMRPHFAYTRDAQNGEGFAHGCPGTLMQHAIGRGMDLMYNYEKYTGNRIDPTVEAAYVRHFYAALHPRFGMCLEFVADGQPWRVELHNVRETVEALTLLLEMRHDGRAYTEMAKIYEGLSVITTPDGRRFDPELAREAGVLDDFTGSIGAPQPMTAGRLTGPLTEYYRLTGDRRALDFARGYAHGTLDCFSDEGEMLRCAGTHIHSITSALSGAAAYATLVGDTEMIAKLVRLFEHPLGLPVIMTDFGWIKEQIYVDGQVQGEVNQIGDMVAFCLSLGRHFNSALWYSRAETLLRGGLLPSQVLRNDFITPTSEPHSDHRRDIPARILGGYGFPMPASHLEHAGSPINTLDITQGANQAICRVLEHIVTAQGGNINVNLLFDADTPDAKIISALPNAGTVAVIPKRAGTLRVRIPRNIAANSLTVRLDTETIPPTIIDDYLVLNVKSYDVVSLQFAPEEITYHTNYIDTDYTVTKRGEQTVRVTPIDGIYPIYED